MFTDYSRREYLGLILLCVAGCALLSFLYGRFTKKREGSISLLVFLNALILHFFYIAYTPVYERQHDVIGFNNGKGIGQAALIEYLMNERKLPDFNPTERWGFFQPLLHHIISAVFLKLNLLTGINYGRACERIQILTFLYSMILIIFAFRIFTLMGLKGKGLLISEILICVHPVFILLSGSVNNDILSHMFLVMAVFYALKWFRDDDHKDLLLTALTVGLSMAAKLSGVLVSPAIAFLMAAKLYNDVRSGGNTGKRILSYVYFALLVFPIGLFFPIRNFLLFNVSPGYIPEVGEDLSGYSLFSRIFDIRTKTPYACMIKNGDAYDEFNVFLAFIKTSLTGEYNYSAVNRYIDIFAWLLFVAGIILFFTAVFLFFRIFFKDDIIKDIQIRLFWVILIVTGILFMLKLALGVPNFSSEDIRYIAWIMVGAAMLPGIYISAGKGRKVLTVLAGLFAFASAGVYYLLGMP